VTGQWWADDDQLAAELGAALRPVPEGFVEAGRAAFAWRDIDAELAALTYDSATDGLVGAGTRAAAAPSRELTFASGDVTIDVEITSEAVIGQVVPPEPGEVRVILAAGTETGAAIDEIGCFVIRPVPQGAFRLRCRTGSGTSILTGWLTP
jgi:hypothetical protein